MGEGSKGRKGGSVTSRISVGDGLGSWGGKVGEGVSG